jgi:hypothetical protein
MRVVCDMCMESLKESSAVKLGKTCELDQLFKTSKTECTDKCRNWLTRDMLFSAISKLRKQIDAEIKALNDLRRVVLHTIAIGEFQKDFMERVAAQNGPGVFVDLGRGAR